MKKIFILLVIVSIIIFPYIKTNKSQVYAQSLYQTYNVEHLFTHCLIAYPEIAFNNKNTMKKYLLNDCITSDEFKLILESLYKNNYVLISINDCFKTINNLAYKTKVSVPTGKKPIILSFDDVNYDSKKIGSGMVDKIILDSNGNIASLTKINNTEDISYDREFISILENFIKNHPDFSPFGAKGCINLTGYDGILGYRTSHTNTISREKEIKEAQCVVNKLKELGWDFASHSYGHYHMNKISVKKFEQELNLWKTEVEPIVGKTNIYVYPYGEWQVFDNGKICDKHTLLNKFGFSLFCGVGMKSFYSYLPNKNGHKVLFMDRKCIDGYTLSNNSKELLKFFNPLQILDPKRII